MAARRLPCCPEASANGHLLLGQNWDWIPEVLGAVVHAREPDGFETLRQAFTEAGIFRRQDRIELGRARADDQWLAVHSRRLGAPGGPVHVRCYDILAPAAGPRLLSALVVAGSRACSANFLVAQTPIEPSISKPRLTPWRAPPTSMRRWSIPITFSIPRRLGCHRARKRAPAAFLLAPEPHGRPLAARAPVSIADLEVALRDHDNYPDGICRHENRSDPPEEWCIAVTRQSWTSKSAACG